MAKTSISAGSAFSRWPKRASENRVYVGRFCSLGFADLGDDVMLADGVQVLSGGHEHGTAKDHRTMREQPQTFRKVRIGRGAWIGAGAIVMADVGESTIVGAGAVVTKPIPSHSIAVGVPARVVRSIRNDDHNFALKSAWRPLESTERTT